jgi:hypothetical protein
MKGRSQKSGDRSVTQQTMKTHDDDISGEIQSDSAAYDLKQCAQRELAAAVLKQAAQDLRRFRGATSKVERELYFDAYRWLTVNEWSSPFSFLNVCQFLHLIPEQVRDELIADASSSAFSYWIRRCGRAASQLQSSVSQFFVNGRNGNAEPGDMVFDNAPSAVGSIST